MLIGRQEELDRLDELLAAARAGTSGALLIEGEPGVGKSALLRYATERAAGMVTLRAQGVEPEAQLAFSGLSELLAPLVGKLDLLPDTQAAAIRGVLALGPASVGGLAVGAATLGALAVAAEQAAVLVAVDDVHWLDPASAQALLFATRRMKAEGIAVVLTARPGEPLSPAFGDQIPIMRLGGLEREPALALLARSPQPIAAAVTEELVVVAEGNPLALLELPGLLSDAQLAGAQPLERPLPVGATLKRAFDRKLDVLPAATRELLLLAAASPSANIGPVLRAGELLGLPAGAGQPAEDAGLLSILQAQVSFQHPLLRSVIYHGATAADRRSAHAALAEALLAGGSAEERAWHLGAATLNPDEHIAMLLEGLAAGARDRGAYAAAAASCERSARLSPQLSDRSRRLLEAAQDLQFIGQFEHCLRLLDEAEESIEDVSLRAEVQRLRAVVSTWAGGDPADTGRLYLDAVARIESSDPERASQILAEAAGLWTMAADVPKMLEMARRAYGLAEQVGDATALGPTAMYGCALILAGRTEEAGRLLERCGLVFDDSALLADPMLLNSLTHPRIWIEQYSEARRILEQVISAARAASAAGVLPFPLACLVELEIRTGRWISAYANALESVQLAEQTGQMAQLAHSVSTLAMVEAGLGHEQACRDHARRAREHAKMFGATSIDIYVGATLGALELGLGQPRRAIEELSPAGRLCRDLGCREPGVVWFGANLVEAYARAGQLEDARRELGVLEREARDTDRAWALTTSARCRGLLADEDSFESEFTEALEMHTALEAPFERARTELCFGERLRRARHPSQARRHLHSACETFDRLDAAPWARSARSELRAAGERVPADARRGPGARLTAQELQVARAVADGATNREAAAALFLSPKTIEFHLSNVYRKLDLRSRSELVRTLLEDDAAQFTGQDERAASEPQLRGAH